MNTQFKFEKQPKLATNFAYLNVTPEQVIMLQLQNTMKVLKIRSFSSYLNKYTQTKKVQRTSITIKEIATLLNISTREADYLAVQWMNNIGGQVTYCADIAAYYVKGVYEITN